MLIKELFVLLHTISGLTYLYAKVSNDCQSWERPFQIDVTLFPFESKCVSLTHGRVHYFDLQPPEMNPIGTILAFHGNPVWSIIFTKLAKKALSDGYRFIAFDYYGYGMSDKPDSNEFDYMIHSQARMAAEFIRKLDLSNLILVVQDGGGPIGLGAAQEEVIRVKGLVIINSWFTETKSISDGTTDDNFIFHDWSMDNIVNERYFVSTGYNSFKGASGTVAAWELDPKSAEAASLIRMMLNPYFQDGNDSKPLTEMVHLPHVRLVQSVLNDRKYFAAIEHNITLLTSKPVYFLFVDPLAFSTLRCDVGPKTRIDLNTSDAVKYGAKQLIGTRALCPKQLVCSDNLPKPFQSKCLDNQGQEYWHVLESFLRVWEKDKITGIYKGFPGHEYFAARSPDQVMVAIQTLNNFTLVTNGSTNIRLYRTVYSVIWLILLAVTLIR